jgi:hypothetical protein
MWSTNDVSRLSGVSYRRLDFWVRGGLLDSVMVCHAAGSGTQRSFASEAPAVAWVLDRLCGGLGLEVAQVRDAVPALAAMVRARRSPLRFAVADDGAVSVVDGVPPVPLEVVLDWSAGIGGTAPVLEAVAVLEAAGLQPVAV